MKKIFLVLIVALSSFIFSACTTKNSSNSVSQKSQKAEKCKQADVSVNGYIEKGKRLGNCFVQYPSEPTRQDKSYYIVEDICGQFTASFISNALGKKIIKTKAPENSDLNNCSYYLNDKDYVMLVLNYLKFANQKSGQEIMGRAIAENPKIPMKNMIAYQEDGQINSMYLVLSDDKFISIQRSSGTAFTSDELINFASNIGQEIKNYK